jgi:uncharacterized protein (DUF302 family)
MKLVLGAVLTLLTAYLPNAQAFELEQLMLKIPVAEGVTGEEVDDSIKNLAVDENILYVFYAPLYKQVEQVTGKKFRYMSIHNICDAKIAAEMADYSDALVIMMPCRISVVEDKDGKLWLYTTNPDLIVSDPNMPAELKAKAQVVVDKMKRIMETAASGDF